MYNKNIIITLIVLFIILFIYSSLYTSELFPIPDSLVDTKVDDSKKQNALSESEKKKKLQLYFKDYTDKIKDLNKTDLETLKKIFEKKRQESEIKEEKDYYKKHIDIINNILNNRSENTK